MSWRDWLQNVHRTARDDSITTAVRIAGQELWQGGLRRGPGRFVSGTSVWDREWNVLCILDACRVDLMAEVCDDDAYEWLPAEVDSLTSVGGNSPEWLNETFAPEYRSKMARTAYVSANPFTDPPSHRRETWPNLPLDENDFGALCEVWKQEASADIEGIGSIDPDVVSEYAIETWRQRETLGIDRMIVHFMQPHAPFRTAPQWSDGQGVNVWSRAQAGDVSPDEIWPAYVDNLEWVLDSISILRKNCAGRIVLSADHGNGMGEWGVWGHPPSTPVSSVRRVPWIEIDGIDTETFIPDVTFETEADRDVVAQLDALGYR